MRRNSHLFRLSATVALGALFGNALQSAAATAQPAPSPAAQPPADAPQNQGDPPARVGRIAGLTGTVSFRTSADTQWSGAATNYPVASGNAFWTEPSAEVTLEISASRVSLAPQTEFDLTSLDPGGVQAVTAQGETYFHLADLQPDEVWSLQTPRGQIRLTSAGRYNIVAGTTEQPTLVTVLEGSAEIDGPGVSLRIAANETATITGSDPFEGSVGPATRDAFLTARLAAERPPSRPAATIPAPVMAHVAAMPGGEDLTTTGNWSDAPGYGQVWYPPVSAGWVPYRQGHWAFVAPWGWTWVDDAPWGFAPFHYGRWMHIGDRWGWTPGQVVDPGPPVYAPALVTFLGIGAAVGIGVGLGAALAGGSIGWVPLGPREAFHPWYHASDTYVRQINSTHVTNVANITNVNNFINRGAATSVPASVMTGSQPVQAAARPVSPQMLASARPVVGQQPIRPTAATLGVTPAVARQLRLAPADPATFHAAPGPVVRAQAVTPAGSAPGAARERPPLPGPQGAPPSAGARPEPSAAPGAVSAESAARPREPGRPPALVPPGARPAGVPIPPAGTSRAVAPQVGTPQTGTAPPGARPEGVAHPGATAGAGTQPGSAPGNHPTTTEHPTALPRVERPTPTPHQAGAAPEIRPAAPPHVTAPAVPRAAPPVAPRVQAPPPPPHVQVPRPAPPHVEAPRPAPPRAEAPRPAPSRAAPEPHPKRPGEP